MRVRPDLDRHRNFDFGFACVGGSYSGGNSSALRLGLRDTIMGLREFDEAQNEEKSAGIVMRTRTRLRWAVSVMVGSIALLPCGATADDTFAKHVVVAQEANAAEAGRAVLVRGGNAIDAAIATAFALAVTLPEAGNLGGGGFIVAYLADRREVVTVDFREMAPRSASERMYLGADGELRRAHRAGLGGRGAGDGARAGPGACSIRQDGLGRSGATGGAAGNRRIRDLARSGRFAQSPACAAGG